MAGKRPIAVVGATGAQGLAILGKLCAPPETGGVNA